MFRRTHINRRGDAAFSVLASFALAAAAPAAANVDDANIGRFRFATGTSSVGDATALFATDGKIGPENIWVTGTRGRHRMNIFFERPTDIGQLHIYSGGDQTGPISSVELFYLDGAGSLVPVPGAGVSGNTQAYLDMVLDAPITTTQLQLSIDDLQATIREVAVFPPLATPMPIGSGVNLNLARQHRLPLTVASSTVNGTSRRAVVDGFVNDAEFWQPNAAANQWISLDLRDPPETSPVSVRAVTSPIEIGSVHLYSGLESGAPPVSRGRFQTLDDDTSLWVDVPGGSFSNNTSRELAVEFDAPITTAMIRLVVQDAGGIVREIVPLPPAGAPGGWPIGTGVIIGDEPDYLEFGDAYHRVALSGSGIALTSGQNGDVLLRDPSAMVSQHYQVLLNVGTDTYRIRSRVTGRCLEPEGASDAAGARVVEAEYIGVPSQRWRRETAPGGVRFVNSQSGLALTAESDASGASIDQQPVGAAGQTWTTEQRARPPKKGNGGFPDLADAFESRWAYNWGPNDSFSENIEFWPMQWGSFFWSTRPSLMPTWMRNPEAITLMGYNEPDREDQADLEVTTGAAMWPRLEVLNTPLLGPAVAGHPATSPWIQEFMARADEDELRLDYVGMHAYPDGINPGGFINQITAAHNAWDRDVVVSEFSVVDWNDNGNFNRDQAFNWFAEVLWRMEQLPYLHSYAVFVFTDEPNSTSENRGEVREADGSLTPTGRMYAAWDADLQIRTDTPYFIHNKASHKRPGAIPGMTGEDSTALGGRYDQDSAFQWRLVPAATPGRFNIRSVSDGTLLTYSGRGLELHPEGAGVGVAEFGIQEIQHGWFAIIEPNLNQRLRSDPSTGAIGLTGAGATSDDARWRFVQVFEGVPGPVRGGFAESVGGGDVLLAWEPHGFRDLIGFSVYRSGPNGGPSAEIAAGVMDETWIDRVPEPGTYTYSVSAVGDTGESEIVSLGAVSVDTCPADFNADFVVDEADIQAAINAIGAGLDYNGDSASDFFDLLDYLRVHDEGCPGE